MHHPVPLLINVLVALAAPAHGQSRIHVHVVAGKVETDEQLEDHAPSGLGRRQKDEETCRGAAVRHHIQHCAELCGLLELAGSVAVQGIEQTRDAVEQGAATRVQRHEI